jgi:hypothetical protein
MASVNQLGIRSRQRGWMPVDGLWDYDGSWINSSDSARVSVAVFQWKRKAHATGIHDCKRDKSVKRFYGCPADKESIIARAEEYCRQIETGTLK